LGKIWDIYGAKLYQNCARIVPSNGAFPRFRAGKAG
jgi:hypothetical protein